MRTKIIVNILYIVSTDYVLPDSELGLTQLNLPGINHRGFTFPKLNFSGLGLFGPGLQGPFSPVIVFLTLSYRARSGIILF